jgi:hypothetical protein
MHQVITKYIYKICTTFEILFMCEGIFKRGSLFLNYMNGAANNRVSNPCTVTFRPNFHGTGKQ